MYLLKGYCASDSSCTIYFLRVYHWPTNIVPQIITGMDCIHQGVCKNSFACLKNCPRPGFWSRRTVMPSVLMIAWSLLLSGLEIFFLQSTIIVTVFFSMLIATRCHLSVGRKLYGKDNKEEPWSLWEWYMFTFPCITKTHTVKKKLPCISTGCSWMKSFKLNRQTAFSLNPFAFQKAF